MGDAPPISGDAIGLAPGDALADVVASGEATGEASVPVPVIGDAWVTGVAPPIGVESPAVTVGVISVVGIRVSNVSVAH